MHHCREHHYYGLKWCIAVSLSLNELISTRFLSDRDNKNIIDFGIRDMDIKSNRHTFLWKTGLV